MHLGPPRFLSLVTVLLATALLTAGCTRPGSDAGAATGADTLTLHLSVLDWVHDDALVEVTFDHIAAYDDHAEAWVPLLTGPARADVLFSAAESEPVAVATVPILGGTYSGFEVIVSQATLVADGSDDALAVAAESCYVPAVLEAPGDATELDVTLVLAGDDALPDGGAAGTFRAALIGTLAGTDDDDEFEIGAPDCRPLG